MNDYEVVTSRSLTDLQDRVREFMRDGMRPVGGIAMLHEEAAGEGERLHIVFAQAMMRELPS